MKRNGWHALALLLALACGELQAAGSWIANAPATQVSLAGRETASEPLRPGGAQASNQAIHSVVWRYRLPRGSALNVRLCHPAGCIPLPTMHGTTHALAGLPADVPLEFRFSLAEGQRPVTVGELQVIVNHR
ncbi:flagellar protein FlhE [Halomonas daqiaonensis]|uniref:Flagellar protein FlhE n=1 Tax=Halomonas daqiaonensis TaxID=650850 RepID=A0A1H7ST73_9GAMM|nr:flagellar protein FlhE [Halomonas daqiaonensis]SEL75638.1 flagellar protein FlhE [Halomonas daqiaonensis]